MAHILIAGLGDLGAGLATRLLSAGHQVSGIRRSNACPAGVDLYAQDLLGEAPVLLPPDQVDLLYVILTPQGRDEAGYRRAFLDIPRRLLEALGRQQPLPPVIFVSSSAVYGDSGGVISEDTPPAPERFNGRVLLAAEEELSTLSLATSVRFSGIYGPGRLSMVRRARAIAAGEPPPEPRFTNRIHSRDCTGLLAQVGERWLAGDMLPPVVLGTDNHPVLNREVLNWIGARLGQPLDLELPDIAPGKRLHSRYIEEGHYRLEYPDFRVGYGEALRADQDKG